MTAVPATSAAPDQQAAEMSALLVTGPGVVELVRLPVPVPGPGEIVVRTTLVGVCGTDAHLIDGASFYLEHGHVTYPFVFGHEYCGVVAATGPGVSGLRTGDRVVGQTMVPCLRCDRCQQ